MSKTNKIIIALVVILAGLLLFWNRSRPTTPAEIQPETGPEMIAEKISVDLVVEGLLNLPTTLEFKKDIILLDALKELNLKYPELNLQTKDFGEMGTLVEQIGAQKNGAENKYWQYFVNGAQPMVGADKYVLQNNDRVEWKFAKSEF